jgi:hypothetical protein
MQAYLENQSIFETNFKFNFPTDHILHTPVFASEVFEPKLFQ